MKGLNLSSFGGVLPNALFLLSAPPPADLLLDT